jgi:hypothetical protein
LRAQDLVLDENQAPNFQFREVLGLDFRYTKTKNRPSSAGLVLHAIWFTVQCRGIGSQKYFIPILMIFPVPPVFVENPDPCTSLVLSAHLQAWTQPKHAHATSERTHACAQVRARGACTRTSTRTPTPTKRPQHNHRAHTNTRITPHPARTHAHSMGAGERHMHTRAGPSSHGAERARAISSSSARGPECEGESPPPGYPCRVLLRSR